MIYVCGGNTVNLPAVWRAQGIDAVLREAWERGVVLAGRRLVEAPLRPIVIDGAGPRPGALTPPDADGAPAVLAAVL